MPKRTRGRRPVHPMPGPIPGIAENIARAITQGPLKTGWEFEKAWDAKRSNRR